MRLASLCSPHKAGTKRSFKETIAVNQPPCGHQCSQASVFFASAPLEPNILTWDYQAPLILLQGISSSDLYTQYILSSGAPCPCARLPLPLEARPLGQSRP